MELFSLSFFRFSFVRRCAFVFACLFLAMGMNSIYLNFTRIVADPFVFRIPEILFLFWIFFVFNFFILFRFTLHSQTIQMDYIPRGFINLLRIWCCLVYCRRVLDAFYAFIISFFFVFCCCFFSFERVAPSKFCSTDTLRKHMQAHEKILNFLLFSALIYYILFLPTLCCGCCCVCDRGVRCMRECADYVCLSAILFCFFHAHRHMGLIKKHTQNEDDLRRITEEEICKEITLHVTSTTNNTYSQKRRRTNKKEVLIFTGSRKNNNTNIQQLQSNNHIGIYIVWIHNLELSGIQIVIIMNYD